MSAIDSSLDQINAAVAARLKSLKKTMTTADLEEAHAFIKEAKELQDTIWAYDAPQYICNPEDPEKGSFEEEFMDMYVQACYLIRYLYQIVDEDRLKEIDGRWILDETQAFIQASREMLGTRIPELPPMRPISKPKSKPAVKALKGKKVNLKT